MKEKYVKVCPRCGSTNVSLIARGEVVGEFCKDCGLGKLGIAPPSSKKFAHFLEVKESELERFRKQLKKKPIILLFCFL